MAEISSADQRPPFHSNSVSVVIPVRDGARYLADAVDSALGQPEVCEVLVIDDGSSDGTAAIAQAMGDRGVRYFRQDPLGAAAARNKGVALAAGAMLAFLDADDLWLPGKLAAELQALQDSKGDLIFTQIEEFVSLDLLAEEAATLRPHIGLLEGVSIVTLLMRRADFLRVGPFDATIRTGEFLHWYARAQELGLRSHTVDQLFARRRLHLNNHGRTSPGRRKEYAAILHEILVRRRKAAQS